MSKIFRLSYIICTAFLICATILPNAYAQSTAATDLYWVDFNKDQEHEDVKLSKALLRNLIDFENAEGFGAFPPEMIAKRINFRGGKSILFARYNSKQTCAFRGCEGYILIKPNPEENWKLGAQLIIDDFWVDTRKQQTEFPRVVAKVGDKPVSYWLWKNNRYEVVR